MKIKCNYIRYRIAEKGMVTFLIGIDEIEMFNKDMAQYKPLEELTIEVKKYKPLRTLAQNAFFHKTVGYLAFKLGMDASLVKYAIKRDYGYKMIDPLRTRKRQSFKGEFIPIPSHLCNKFEEMSALIEGCFREAGEQGIDMRDYVLKWEQYKKERAKNETKNS